MSEQATKVPTPKVLPGEKYRNDLTGQLITIVSTSLAFTTSLNNLGQQELGYSVTCKHNGTGHMECLYEKFFLERFTKYNSEQVCVDAYQLLLKNAIEATEYVTNGVVAARDLANKYGISNAGARAILIDQSLLIIKLLKSKSSP